jgi:hypothetical protein
VSPADVKIVWPTSCEIARAVFVAAALEGYDALDVLQGTGSARARAYAAVALAHQFPTAPRSALGRKCGNDTCLPNFRSGLKTGTLKWFDLARLNAVRAALGWSDMTFDEALVAPLLYCGRPWEEFIDRAATGIPVGVEAPVAGSEIGKEPSPITNAIAKATKGKTQAEAGSEDGTELRVGEAGVAHPLPGAGGVQSGPRADDSERLAAGERRKARRALNNAPPAATGKALFAPAPKDTRNEIADNRRPTNELQGRLLNVSLRGVTSFRPDPPAEKRGAVVIPLEGERPPGRLRTDQIDALEGRR